MRPRFEMRDLYRGRTSSAGSLIGTVLRLFLLCVVVGVVMTFFGITPRSLFADTIGTLRDAYALAERIIHWSVPYALLGASVVVPIVLVVLFLRLIRR